MEVLLLSDLPSVLKKFFNRDPKNVRGQEAVCTQYYKDKLLRLVFGRFRFNLPNWWDKDYFLLQLFCEGYLAITDTSAGVLPLQCGFTGVNVFNRPTTINIENVLLGHMERIIDVNAVLLKLQYDYNGILGMIAHYAEMLASCDCSIDVSLMNSRVAFIFPVENKKESDSLKLMYDDISKGKPATFIRKDSFSEAVMLSNNPKNIYVGEDVQITKRKIVNEFLTDIGINNANIDKRERLNEEEVLSNNDECKLSVQHWLNNINEGFSKANDMFNLNLSVELERSYVDGMEEFGK